jgi:flagellar motor switch protein FliM
MKEVLSQKEIEQLLTAINTTSGTVTSRPDKFSKEQLRAVSYIHETFANLTTYSLSTYIRSMFHVHVSSVEELTYEEFIRSLPTHTTLAAININPLKRNVILEISSEITFAIIDRLCGGNGDGTKFHHGLTDIETSIMDNIIVHLLGNLREAWNQVLDMNPQVKAIDTDPQSVRIVSPNEIVVLVTLETKIGEVEGMMNICIPCSTIEPIIEKLTNWYWNKNPDNTQSTSPAAVEPLEEKSRRIPKKNERKKFKSFNHINRVDPVLLLNFIQSEHPQIIALVLAHMKPDKASIILQNLLSDMQSDVFRRITVMDCVRDEIASEIERVTEDKIIALSYKKNCSVAGGVESAVKILNLVDKASSKQIIDKLEKEDPFLAEEIKKRARNIN